MRTTFNTRFPALLSSVISFMLPLLLALYWPMIGLQVPSVPTLLRVGLMLSAALLVAIWRKARTSESELNWVRTFTLFLTSLLLAGLLATNYQRALQNWVRICILLGFCLVLARAFRHPATRRAFGVGALVASVFLSVYILGCYMRFLGMAVPTYESTRIFKATLVHAIGVSLNPLGFSAAFSCVLAACTLRPSWALNATLVTVVMISTVFTGSRTPLALMVLSVVIVMAVELLARSNASLRWACLLIVLPSLLGVGAYRLAQDGIDLQRWSVITEGRTDLWQAALARFAERPLTGYGADSWGDDLISRLPGFYTVTRELVDKHAGGYHNAYLTLLAEDGLFVFACALYMIGYAYRTIGRSMRGDRAQRGVFLFALTFLVLRGLVEVPGLFGYGEDPAEYGAYALLALLISYPIAAARSTNAAADSNRIHSLSMISVRLAQL